MYTSDCRHSTAHGRVKGPVACLLCANRTADKPVLAQAAKDTQQLLEEVATDQANADEVKQKVTTEEAEVGEIAKEAKAFFHTDAAQMVGKLPFDVNEIGCDLVSISGHKLYGPKGIGALYVRRRPRVRLEPVRSGGGQERGFRSGTLPTALCVGLGAAADVALK